MRFHLLMSRTLQAITAIALLVSTFGSTKAADRVWTGGDIDDNLWTSPDNWFGNAAPMNNVDALIFGGNVRLNNQNNFAAGTIFRGITFAGGAGSFNLSGNNMTLGTQVTGFGITHSGDIVNNSTNAQTISMPLTLAAGKHVITTGNGGLNLSGAITRNPGSAVIFNPGSGAINVAGTGLTTSNGILGGWATIGGDWATLDGSNNVVPYSNYTAALPGGTIANDPLVQHGPSYLCTR
jgi:hypothetical protein